MAAVEGGVARVIRTLASSQARRGEVAVMVPGGVCSPMETPQVHYEELTLRGNSDLLGHRGLLRQLAALSPDVVVLHAASPGELALATALVSRRYATILVEHAAEFYPLRSAVKDRVFAALKRRAGLWAAVSESSARALERSWGLAPGSLATLRNGVDAPDDAPPGEQHLREAVNSGRTVVALGRPIGAKGFDIFVHCATALAQEFPHHSFLWIGSQARERAGVVDVFPWTRHVGWILRRSDLLLLPSRVEAFGLVVLESWACRTAVVASRVGGITEVVHDGVDGLLVRPEDLEGWVSTVGAVLRDGAARELLAEEGHSTWRREYTALAMRERYDAAIRTILGHASREG